MDIFSDPIIAAYCSGQVNLATSLASIANCHSAALGDRPPLCLCGLI
jgi:hypothetical protein